MELTLFGVVLGAVASGAITHVYHKLALASTRKTDPIPVLDALTAEIQKLRASLDSHVSSMS